MRKKNRGKRDVQLLLPFSPEPVPGPPGRTLSLVGPLSAESLLILVFGSPSELKNSTIPKALRAVAEHPFMSQRTFAWGYAQDARSVRACVENTSSASHGQGPAPLQEVVVIVDMEHRPADLAQLSKCAEEVRAVCRVASLRLGIFGDNERVLEQMPPELKAARDAFDASWTFAKKRGVVHAQSRYPHQPFQRVMRRLRDLAMEYSVQRG